MTPLDPAVPRLSVVLPTHNEEALIAGALETLLARLPEYPAATEVIVACNGCTDRSAEIACDFPVTVIEDTRSGMSFGNNLGGRAAQHEMLLFLDVDTVIGPGGFAAFADALRGREDEVVGSFWTHPDKRGLRSIVFFFIMNQFCRYKGVPQIGTIFLHRAVYERIGGFDESIPQGTASDLSRRAKEAGAGFVMVMTHACQSSVRRLEQRGYLRQVLEWRRNIRYHSAGEKERLRTHEYDVYR